jgi:hypothetical protein
MFEHWIETHNREALGGRVNLRPDEKPPSTLPKKPANELLVVPVLENRRPKGEEDDAAEQT